MRETGYDDRARPGVPNEDCLAPGTGRVSNRRGVHDGRARGGVARSPVTLQVTRPAPREQSGGENTTATRRDRERRGAEPPSWIRLTNSLL